MNLQTILVQEHMECPMQLRSHGYYQLMYCKKAGGTVEIEGHIYEASCGMVYFVKPMQLCIVPEDVGQHLMGVKFGVGNEDFVRWLAMLPACFMPKDVPSFRRGWMDILKEGNSQAFYGTEAANAVLELLLIRLVRPFAEPIWEPLGSLRELASANPQDNMDARITALPQWIEVHVADNITLEILCQISYINKSALVEGFKRLYHMPPMKYVNWVRLTKAKELLEHTEKKITDIVKETGFRGIPYFSRYFKARENMTPTAYRLQYGRK